MKTWQLLFGIPLLAHAAAAAEPLAATSPDGRFELAFNGAQVDGFTVS